MKDQGLQAENERLLALQQKTNDRLRDLELSNEEKASLLRAALLDRENLSPALLELKRAETLQRIREQIERVTKAPSENQSKVLDVTASEIAETVLQSEAALDNAKKVSLTQLPLKSQEVSAFDIPVFTARKPSSSSKPTSNETASGRAISNPSLSPTITMSEVLRPLKLRGGSEEELVKSDSKGQIALGRVTHFFRRQRYPTMFSEIMRSRPDSCLASPAPGMLRRGECHGFRIFYISF